MSDWQAARARGAFVAGIASSLSASAWAAIELPATKEGMIALGREHRTAWVLHKAFEAQEDSGGHAPNPLPDRNLRIRYRHCGENQNNGVLRTEDGSSQSGDVTSRNPTIGRCMG